MESPTAAAPSSASPSETKYSMAAAAPPMPRPKTPTNTAPSDRTTPAHAKSTEPANANGASGTTTRKSHPKVEYLSRRSTLPTPPKHPKIKPAASAKVGHPWCKKENFTEAHENWGAFQVVLQRRFVHKPFLLVRSYQFSSANRQGILGRVITCLISNKNAVCPRNPPSDCIVTD